MFKYKAPQCDYRFVMQKLLYCKTHYKDLGYDDTIEEMVDAILSEVRKFTEQVIAPINQIVDQQGFKEKTIKNNNLFVTENIIAGAIESMPDMNFSIDDKIVSSDAVDFYHIF